VPVHDPGKDPIHEVVGIMRESLTVARAPMPAPFYTSGYPGNRESGLSMAKEGEISVGSFTELAEILGKFDALADELECSHPAAGS
jgi:hypothetical protein